MLPSESHFQRLTVLCKALQDLVSCLLSCILLLASLQFLEHISLTFGLWLFFYQRHSLSQVAAWSSSASKTSFLITLLCIGAQFDPFSELISDLLLSSCFLLFLSLLWNVRVSAV